jgi:hypothetical protein
MCNQNVETAFLKKGLAFLDSRKELVGTRKKSKGLELSYQNFKLLYSFLEKTKTNV